MDNIRQSFGKFLFPIFLILLGIVTILISIVADQNAKFIFGGLAIMLIGIISGLYSLDIITKNLQRILTTVMIVGAIGLAYWDYRSIQDDIEFANKKKRIYAEVIQNLKDIRTAQIAHKKIYGGFVANFDSLLDFIHNGEMPIIKAIGMVPDTLSEDEALELGIIVRDTIYEPVKKRIYYTKEAMEDRDFPLNLDSLAYAPYSGKKFFMDAGDINQGGVRTPVFVVKDMAPFDPIDTLMVGSMEKATTNGNWSGE